MPAKDLRKLLHMDEDEKQFETFSAGRGWKAEGEIMLIRTNHVEGEVDPDAPALDEAMFKCAKDYKNSL